MELEFEINFGSGWQSVAPPRNARSITPHIIFTSQHTSVVFRGLTLEWTGATAIRLGQYWDAGLTGGPGIYEGPGLRIYACTTPRQKFFDGYIDLADESTMRECDVISAPAVEARVDDIMKKLEAIPFSVLASLPVGKPGRIVPVTDYKLTPYCINNDFDYVNESIVAVSIFMTIKEAIELSKEIGQLIQEIYGAVATATATLGAATGLVFVALAKVLIYTIYLAALIVALVNMIRSLIDNIFQFKKSKACMLYRTHFIRACQYLGLQFSSTILNNPASKYYNDTWMPPKNIIPDPLNPLSVFRRPYDESVNFPNNTDVYGHYDGTAAAFIRHCMDKYSAEIVVIGNTLYFEEKHYWNNQASVQLPNQGLVGNTFNYPAPYGTNASELPSAYFVGFAVDQSDTNTLNRYKGTTWEVTIRPNTVINQRNISHKTGVVVQLECALAKRKEYLTKVETLLNTLINGLFGFVNAVTSLVNGVINVVNWVIGLFGGSGSTVPTIPPLPTNILNNRIGWMVLSADTFSVPKSFIGRQQGSDWVISSTSETDMSARSLGDDFHGKNLATRGNQQLKYRDKEFKFCCSDYLAIMNKNAITTVDGRRGYLMEFVWNVYEEKAQQVEYRIFSNFTSNISEKVVIDGK